jgi:hypothetical protein
MFWIKQRVLKIFVLITAIQRVPFAPAAAAHGNAVNLGNVIRAVHNQLGSYTKNIIYGAFNLCRCVIVSAQAADRAIISFSCGISLGVARRVVICMGVLLSLQLKLIFIDNFHKPLPELFTYRYAFISDINMVVLNFTELLIIDDIRVVNPDKCRLKLLFNIL